MHPHLLTSAPCTSPHIWSHLVTSHRTSCTSPQIHINILTSPHISSHLLTSPHIHSHPSTSPIPDHSRPHITRSIVAPVSEKKKKNQGLSNEIPRSHLYTSTHISSILEFISMHIHPHPSTSIHTNSTSILSSHTHTHTNIYPKLTHIR
jgi:hypothetical protein